MENLGREKPLPKQEILLKAGYSPAVAKNPDIVLESKGYLELLEVYLPDQDLLQALADDIKAKPANRKAELELAFKVKGKLKDREASGPTYNIAVFSNEQQRRIAERILGSDTPTVEGPLG